MVSCKVHVKIISNNIGANLSQSKIGTHLKMVKISKLDQNSTVLDIKLLRKIGTKSRKIGKVENLA